MQRKWVWRDQKRRKRGEKSVIHEEFFGCLRKKKVQVHITSDFRDRKMRRMGNNEVMAAVRNAMARRD